MPTIPSIRTSVENQSVLVLDNHAKNGIFRRDARGRLIAYAGGFSVVFPYETSNKEKWAFRCWHSDVNNSQRRYEIISDAIQEARLDFLCGFDYIEKGINVEGKVYPTTRMRWIDGTTLKDYICQNRTSKHLLKKLAKKFLAMTRALHNLSLAHGDLQHGNILVSNKHQLYLVDYDSFYCPALKGEADNVTGLPDYQHPARISNNAVSERLDYFSELIIYLSILAIAENPSLIDKYRVEDADRLLFSKEDFVDIQNAQIYKDIYSLGKEFQEMLTVLEEYLGHKSIDDLIPFESCLLYRKVSFTASATKAVRNTQLVKLDWNIPFDAEINLYKGRDRDVQRCKRKGKYATKLPKSTTFELSVKTPEGVVMKKDIAIGIFDEAEIKFSADKYFIYPEIPVVLSWQVKYAKKVWLDSEEVAAVGKKVVEPQKATFYVLSAEDEFGKKEKRIDIQMLPTPQVRALLVPRPKLTNNLTITVLQPRHFVELKIPQIEVDGMKTTVPKVPSLTDLGLNVELSPPLPKFSLKNALKRIFNTNKKK